MLKYKDNKGFTLIELMVVVAIIAILSTIGISGFSSAQKKARDARRRADVKTIQSSVISSADLSGNYDAIATMNEMGGAFPVDPRKTGAVNDKYFLFAPVDETKTTELANVKASIAFIPANTAPYNNSGIVCAVLENPNTGNAARAGADATTRGTTTTSAATFGAPDADAKNPDAFVVVGNYNGSVVITGTEVTGGCDSSKVTTEGVNNCNLFCATF